VGENNAGHNLVYRLASFLRVDSLQTKEPKEYRKSMWTATFGGLKNSYSSNIKYI
jgi:hypothetical protein